VSLRPGGKKERNMKFKCPHCAKVDDFTQVDLKKIFLVCSKCKKQFRPSECSPIIRQNKKAIDRELHKLTNKLR